MANELEDKGVQDASIDLQKVAGVRSDHRIMMIDPITRRFVYAEPDQLGGAGGGGGSGSASFTDDSFDI
jgi:hypothetical protein